MTAWGAALILLWLVVILLAFALAGVVRQVRELAERITSPSGTLASGPVLTAPAVELESGALIEPPYVAVFVSSRCAVCDAVMQRLASALPVRPPRVPTLVVGDGGGPTGPLAQRQASFLHVVENRHLAAAFGVPAMPWVVAVKVGGVIALSRSAGPPSKVNDLLASAEVLVSSQAPTVRDVLEG